jgi:hypothetical protein
MVGLTRTVGPTCAAGTALPKDFSPGASGAKRPADRGAADRWTSFDGTDVENSVKPMVDVTPRLVTRTTSSRSSDGRNLSTRASTASSAPATPPIPTMAFCQRLYRGRGLPEEPFPGIVAHRPLPHCRPCQASDGQRSHVNAERLHLRALASRCAATASTGRGRSGVDDPCGSPPFPLPLPAVAHPTVNGRHAIADPRRPRGAQSDDRSQRQSMRTEPVVAICPGAGPSVTRKPLKLW